ncbi:threonine aldolase [Sesbania bispinosa]|nr:threonine aldolase [Sesbania bispinosa]
MAAPTVCCSQGATTTMTTINEGSKPDLLHLRFLLAMGQRQLARLCAAGLGIRRCRGQWWWPAAARLDGSGADCTDLDMEGDNSLVRGG